MVSCDHALRSAIEIMAKSRSPNYPLIPLSEALDGIAKVYKLNYKHKVDKKVVAQHLGYGGINGKSLGVISSLSKYGLLEGRGELRVTDDAVTILVDQKDSSARQQAIRRAALRPALFAQLNTHFGGVMPSTENLSAYLQKNGFTPQASQLAGKSYRDTMEFVTREAGDSVKTNDEPPPVQAGDWAQWESQGVYQFETPKRVVSLSPDGSFAFVEGTTTGIPADQLRKVDPPPAQTNLGNLMKPAPPVGTVREVSVLDEGEAVLQWPASLSAASVEELEAWLQLVIKKVKRRVATT
jgi:hypothetical protein